jgi:hypothetical protein
LVLVSPLAGRSEDGGSTTGAQAEVRRHSLQVVVDTLFIDVDGVVPLDEEALPCHFGSEIVHA